MLHTFTHRLLLLGTVSAAFGLAPLAMAQAVAPSPAPAPMADGPAARAELNREQANIAQQQLDLNATNQAAYDRAVAHRERIIRRQERLTARNDAEYDAAMARWHATVDACRKGDRQRCEEGQLPLPAQY